jgi:hypothetical protein
MIDSDKGDTINHQHIVDFQSVLYKDEDVLKKICKLCGMVEIKFTEALYNPLLDLQDIEKTMKYIKVSIKNKDIIEFISNINKLDKLLVIDDNSKVSVDKNERISIIYDEYKKITQVICDLQDIHVNGRSKYKKINSSGLIFTVGAAVSFVNVIFIFIFILILCIIGGLLSIYKNHDKNYYPVFPFIET